ncbi:hypothetical protein AVEN_132093-1 [Araneus ventricosus]|uniref:CCHC-type domain-containing protein n=1 Tax=Araneus ventricosus TaxID=182803 RepID=A0A4Y2FB94_ARAVE|nr:hypothetical protein AVEN_132093-1 [Araneus ventricosus]
MAALHINPPENFTFSTPCNWSKWKMRFERYRIASGLSTKTGNEQANSLLYIMGEQAEDIFSSFGLSETEQDDFDIVLKKFNDHFVVKKNTIFERAQFNKRVQLDDESVNTFITALYTLSEHCEYGVLHDELIRDRIVVGIRDKNLSEKLQLDADLTLPKVIERVRLSEVVKEQQGNLIEKDSASVNAISPNRPAKFLKQKPSSGARKQNVKPDFHTKNNENESRLHGKCKWCGKQRHDKRVRPARDARCRQCSKIGHYAKVCITKSQTGCSEVAYLGVVQLESKNKTNTDWTVTVQVNHKNIKFKIDSEADHTVLPANVFQNVFQNAKLEPPDKILYFHPEPEPEEDCDVTGYQHSPDGADPGCPPLMSSPQSPKTYPERASSSTEASPDPYVTRSGRTVRPPERLDL